MTAISGPTASVKRYPFFHAPKKVYPKKVGTNTTYSTSYHGAHMDVSGPGHTRTNRNKQQAMFWSLFGVELTALINGCWRFLFGVAFSMLREEKIKRKHLGFV